MLSARDLDKAYNNGNLCKILNLVSDEELTSLYACVACDDILGIRINIMDAICTEMEARNINILRRK